MANRRQTSAVNSEAYHTQQIEQATSELGKFWKACGWLAAEARRGRRLRDVTNAVLDLVHRVRLTETLPDAPAQLAHLTTRPGLNPPAWYLRDEDDTDPRERVA